MEEKERGAFTCFGISTWCIIFKLRWTAQCLDFSGWTKTRLRREICPFIWFYLIIRVPTEKSHYCRCDYHHDVRGKRSLTLLNCFSKKTLRILSLVSYRYSHPKNFPAEWEETKTDKFEVKMWTRVENSAESTSRPKNTVKYEKVYGKPFNLHQRSLTKPNMHRVVSLACAYTTRKFEKYILMNYTSPAGRSLVRVNYVY